MSKIRASVASAAAAAVAALTLALVVGATGCSEETTPFASVQVIDSMAQTIGGPAAAGRPGDFLLQNDRIRAIVHGRHNQRSTFPIGNGSLVDVDIQRPQVRFRNGRGRDAFYEMSSMLNLKVNTSIKMSKGRCNEIGAAPCPTDADGQKLDCARVSAEGPGEDIMGILGLLDFAIQKKGFDNNDLVLVADYDLCPGESTIRTTTTVRYFGKGDAVTMPKLTQQSSLLDALLGERLDINCAPDPSLCPAGSKCVDLLLNVSVGTLKTEMKRCRRDDQKLSGIIAGDFMLFSGKVRVFIPGSGYDHETYIRSVFDTGGDIFSKPLSLDYVAAVGDGVSYVYYGQGKSMIPVFAESFTVSMTNTFACKASEPDCFKGKELRYQRFISVGQGDVASALAGYYKQRGIATGRIEGHVIDARTRRPVSGISVFALRWPDAWKDLGVEAVAAKSYQELVEANVKETVRPSLPLGEAGVVSHFRTDVGLDVKPDGSFGGPIPPGRYILVTRDVRRPTSRLVPIIVRANETSPTTLIANESGRLQYAIRDRSGRSLPSKLTIGVCLPECARDADCKGKVAGRPFCDTATRICVANKDGKASSADDCRPDQTFDATSKTCKCSLLSRLPLELGGSRLADNTVRAVQSHDGDGDANLPPGTYQVIVSRGLEYNIHKQYVTILPGQATRITATLERVVKTPGWVSADFHVHGPNSVDSGLDFAPRVTSYAAEGVELFSSSDHDQITDYAPTVFALGLKPWVKSQVGLEVSPLDYGHFIGFPLVFDERVELNGGFHWRKGKGANVLPKPPVNDWDNVPPKVIFDNLRERGRFGPENTVAAVAHFYDHFQFYDVNPWTLALPGFSLNGLLNRTLTPARFSANHDAVEGMNGKNFDIIRRPSWKEIREYNIKLTAILGDAKKPYSQRLAEWAQLSYASQRAFMMRTPSEQKLAINYGNADFECRCTADVDCGDGFICNLQTGGCLRTCTSDASCDKNLVKTGREKCLPVDGDAKRLLCQRVAPSCSRTAQCNVLWSGKPESCVAADANKPNERTCQIPCKGDSDCNGDAMRSSCRQGRCQPRQVTAATDDDPCPTVRGTVDDWFQMLNRGVVRTWMGNSDSHDLYGLEAGLPRNYVKSDADTAGAIKPLAIAKAVKAGESFSTSGPFVEFTIDGKGLGSTVTAQAGATVRLKIRVQSPLWFDVDRLEIYRNGQLIKVATGKEDCAAGADDCIKLPNDKIVNYDAVIEDKPTRDAWYVVIAMGVDGKALSPVYSSTPVARLGIFELIQRLTPLLPPLRSLRTPFSPTISVVRPYAVTNPIWVDVGADGLTSVSPPPPWATKADRARFAGSKSSSLKQSSAASSGSGGSAGAQARAAGAGHDHRIGLGRLRRDARTLRELIRSGKLTRKAILRSLRSLRYLRSR